MKFLTLLTDFGLRDGYVGVMKGVIYGIAPDVQIADITHTISPQNVLEGALALKRAVPYFPAGTVHVAVVDPGVGTHRRAIAAKLGSQYFVAPDNGLLTYLIVQAEEAHQEVKFVHLTNPKYWLEDISHSFHGRDIFSPVGAHLANGAALEELGEQIADPIRLELPLPQRTAHGWQGEVISIDNFGNLATNLSREHLDGLGPLKVRVGGVELDGLVETFGSRPVGELAALYGTMHDLIIAVVQGSAAQRLGAKVGDLVEVVVS